MYLNCHSYFSLRYGTISVDDLVALGIQNKTRSLALTDINCITGIYDFVLECRLNNIKPLVGVEFRNGNGADVNCQISDLTYQILDESFDRDAEDVQFTTKHGPIVGNCSSISQDNSRIRYSVAKVDKEVMNFAEVAVSSSDNNRGLSGEPGYYKQINVHDLGLSRYDTFAILIQGYKVTKSNPTQFSKVLVSAKFVTFDSNEGNGSYASDNYAVDDGTQSIASPDADGNLTIGYEVEMLGGSISDFTYTLRFTVVGFYRDSVASAQSPTETFNPASGSSTRYNLAWRNDAESTFQPGYGEIGAGFPAVLGFSRILMDYEGDAEVNMIGYRLEPDTIGSSSMYYYFHGNLDTSGNNTREFKFRVVALVPEDEGNLTITNDEAVHTPTGVSEVVHTR